MPREHLEQNKNQRTRLRQWRQFFQSLKQNSKFRSSAELRSIYLYHLRGNLMLHRSLSAYNC